MLAIHNWEVKYLDFDEVANAFAKLSKCQQFTTHRCRLPFAQWLQTLLQSYQNVSNSQHLLISFDFVNSCKRFCKVIKMLAIHNDLYNAINKRDVANAFAKLSKCQQFTTVQHSTTIQPQLQTLLQSYQNVSNSQLRRRHIYIQLGCKRFCKVIKMLAIHNNSHKIFQYEMVANAFAKLSKCQQFTTIIFLAISLTKLQTLLQSYQNVSNSQLTFVYIHFIISCKRFCKVIKMLAIHNAITLFFISIIVANAFAKLSKCQQFTTHCLLQLFHIQLQTLLQSYQNVSNSQLQQILTKFILSCKRFCKVIKMLAIHN